jgi:hypothetical protein
MWSMTMGEFYIGGYFSTMSETVCHWRGQSRVNSSNICSLPTRLRKGWVDVRLDLENIEWRKKQLV